MKKLVDKNVENPISGTMASVANFELFRKEFRRLWKRKFLGVKKNLMKNLAELTTQISMARMSAVVRPIDLQNAVSNAGDGRSWSEILELKSQI